MQTAKSLPATDPNVKLPRAAQAAAARSNEYYKKPDEAPADPPADPAPDAPPKDEPVVTATGGEPGPATPVVVATDPAPSPPAEPPKEPPKDPPTNWERAFKSMKGRYERSEQAVNALRSQLGELQNIVTTLQEAPKKAPAQQPRTADRLITEEDVKDYGQDLLDVVGRKAKEDLLPLVADLRAELADIKSKLHGTDDQLKTSAKQRMFDTLDTRFPKWRQLNEDQDFLNWLDLPDSYSGAIRRQLLNQAVEESSANRVLAFFNGFLAEEAANGPEPNALVTQPTPPRASVEKTPLEAFAAPGRAKSAAASNAPAEKPIITSDQITAFYADVRRGLYKGREAEKLAAETMISEASRDGRIR